MVGNVGLWRAETFRCEESNRRLENGRAMPLEMPTTSKTDKKIKVLLHQFPNVIFILHYLCLWLNFAKETYNH